MQETLAALQQQQEKLEQLAKEMEEHAESLNSDEHMRGAEAIQDPVARTRAIADVLQQRASAGDQQAMNLVMRRIIELEKSVIYLSDRMQRVEQALGQ